MFGLDGGASLASVNRSPLASRRGALLAATLAALTWTPGALAQLSPRYDHTAIYDPLRQRMIVFGGTDANSYFNDVWELSLTGVPQWTPRTTHGTPPSPRTSHAAILDPVRNRMIVFGGVTPKSGLDEVWALSLTDLTWSKMQPTGVGPSARSWSSAVYDPACDRMIVYGGVDALFNDFPEVWCLWLSSTPRWELLPLDPSSPIPPPRYHHSAIYDSAGQRMVVFAGARASNDAWALSLGDAASCSSSVTLPAWSEIQPSGPLRPPALSGHTAVYDPIGQSMTVFGGSDGNRPRNDTWLLSLAGTPEWSVVRDADDTPGPRAAHSAVYDPASRDMFIFGGYPGDVEPAWALSLGVEKHWSPWRPKIEVTPAVLQLPPVTIGDVTSVVFSILNRGLQPLTISDARLPHSDDLPVPGMSLRGPPPLSLDWNAASPETLILKASAPDTVRDSLVLVSNDQYSPRQEVVVTLRVLGLEFETRVLGGPDPVRPGNSFDVVVTPEPGVHFERGVLCYRVAGDSAVFDSLALTALSTDFIATIPGSAVTEHGVEYFVRVENGGVSATRPLGAPATLDTQQVAPPASIAAVHPRPTSGTDFVEDRQIPVDVTLPDGTVFVSGTMHYRRGGEPEWRTEPLVIGSFLGSVIPDSVVGPRGIEYWVEVQTLTTVLRFPEAAGAFGGIRVKVLNLTEPAEHPALRYRLLSVPLDFGETFSGSLDDLLTDQFDAYDPIKWRAFLYDPALPGNVEFSSNPASFVPAPGLAYWLITRGSHRVDTQPIVGYSTPTDSNYAIELKQGWNLFGNPFDFPVAWSDVQRDAAVSDSVVAFDPGLKTIGGYASQAPSVLLPFEGYFVWADAATTLRVPPRAAPTTPKPAPIAATAASSSDPWRISLEARTETAIDGANELGLDPLALAGWDRLDAHEPPTPPGRWVRVAFAHRDWDARSGEYRRDLRAPGTEGETWEVELRSQTPAEQVSLRVSPAIAPGANLYVRLVDREQGIVTDVSLDTGSSHSILSLGDARPYRLAILAGTREYVERESRADQVTPARLLLEPNAPNPFSAATRIRFGLPRNERVTLEVFDIQGHRVATLLDHAPLAPGYHSMIWDGISGGHRAPSGVYLLRLAGEETLMSRRIILTR